MLNHLLRNEENVSDILILQLFVIWIPTALIPGQGKRWEFRNVATQRNNRDAFVGQAILINVTHDSSLGHAWLDS